MAIVSTQSIGLGAANAAPMTPPPNTAQSSTVATPTTQSLAAVIGTSSIERTTGRLQADKERTIQSAPFNKRSEGSFSTKDETRENKEERGPDSSGKLSVRA